MFGWLRSLVFAGQGRRYRCVLCNELRQENPHGCPLVLLALERDVATELVRQAHYGTEAEAAAFPGWAGGVEGLERACLDSG